MNVETQLRDYVSLSPAAFVNLHAVSSYSLSARFQPVNSSNVLSVNF